jgi:hypothetical protein
VRGSERERKKDLGVRVCVRVRVCLSISAKAGGRGGEKHISQALTYSLFNLCSYTYTHTHTHTHTHSLMVEGFARCQQPKSVVNDPSAGVASALKSLLAGSGGGVYVCVSVCVYVMYVRHTRLLIHIQKQTPLHTQAQAFLPYLPSHRHRHLHTHTHEHQRPLQGPAHSMRD